MSELPILSIVIPVYNERETILPLLRRIRATDTPGVQKEIIIVDDGSTDGTRDVLSKLSDCRVILLPENRGKGHALREGFAATRGAWIIVQDADWEYDPADYTALLAPLKSGAPIVYGSRLLGKKWKDIRTSSSIFFLGGVLVSAVTDILYRSRLTDVSTGYKLFRKEVLEQIPLSCESFEFCTEFTAKALRRHIPIVEVPISYAPRGKQEGKKIRWRDGATALMTLWKYRNF